MAARILSLHIYPVKSCAAIDLTESSVDRAGLQGDRQWMLVTRQGQFMTQRHWPAMATIQPTLTPSHLIVRAPGMPHLEIPLVPSCLDVPVSEVTVWDDRIRARDEGAEVSAWFSQFLGVACVLVKVDAQAQRSADSYWVDRWRHQYPRYAQHFCGNHCFGFADGFPLLVANQASLDDLNQRLFVAGECAVPMNRFRPNIVIQGEWEAYDEDLTVQVSVGAVRLAFVKPCARCPMPNVDQQTGQLFHEPAHTLASYRQQSVGVVFGQNAIVSAPPASYLTVGDEVVIDLNF